MSPAPPASASLRENSSTPIRSTGFQYVMTSTATSVAAVMPATTSKTLSTRKPLAMASVVAAWMTGPSMTGSEYGDADFDQVGAVLRHGDAGVDGGLDVGVAGRQVADRAARPPRARSMAAADLLVW